jgi:hypothetical protein
VFSPFTSHFSSQEHFAEKVSTAFNDPRLQLFFEDAAKFIVDQGSTAEYDCVIVDSSDPVGPAESLFQLQFFQSIRDSLNPNGGILCTQGECQWLHLDLIQNLVKSCGEIFPVVKYGHLSPSSLPHISHVPQPTQQSPPTHAAKLVSLSAQPFLRRTPLAMPIPLVSHLSPTHPLGLTVPSPHPRGLCRNETNSALLLLCPSLRSLHSPSIHSQSSLRRLLTSPRSLRLSLSRPSPPYE